jgi:hypothetical protein
MTTATRRRPLREIIALRDPSTIVSDQVFDASWNSRRTRRRLGQYSTQARFRAFALAAELRAGASSLAA